MLEGVTLGGGRLACRLAADDPPLTNSVTRARFSVCAHGPHFTWSVLCIVRLLGGGTKAFQHRHFDTFARQPSINRPELSFDTPRKYL